MGKSVQQSRLGRVLVNKGIITESQLNFALTEQGRSRKRLGEILLDNGYISNNQLESALKRQDLLRRVAAFTTIAWAPFHAVAGFSVPSMVKPVVPSVKTSSEIQFANLPAGFVALSDAELESAEAQGPFVLGSELLPQFGYEMPSTGAENKLEEDDEDTTEEQVAFQAMDAVTTVMGFGPLSNFIEADVTIDGFRRFDDMPAMTILDDGGVRFYTGFEADRISIENVRVKGSSSPDTIGSFYISDVSFDRGSSLTIRGEEARW